jgi:hypothetical protein
MLKVFRDEETGLIKSLRTGEVLFSYAFLTRPKPEGDFKAGYYGADLIIEDQDTLEAVKEYIKQEIEVGKQTKFDGKLGKGFHIPLRQGDPEVELEEDKFVLKANTKFQPQVLIKDYAAREVREITEDEVDEIYSGMYGSAVIKIKPYSYSGQKGVSCYLSSVLKTRDGDPLGSSMSYIDMFEEDMDFEDIEDELEEQLQPKEEKTTSSKKNTSSKTSSKKNTSSKKEEVDVDSLIEGSKKDSGDNEDTKELSIEDLL